MSELMRKILSEGTTPIMTDDNLLLVLTNLHTIYSKKERHSTRSRFASCEVSRIFRTKDFKPAQITTTSQETLINAKKNIAFKIVESITNQLQTFEGLTREEKIENFYNAIKGVYKFSLEDFTKLINCRDKNEVYNYICNNPNMNNILPTFYNGSIEGDQKKCIYLPFKKDVGADYDYRIYLNSAGGDYRVKFLEQYISKCIERGVPYALKGEVSDDSAYELDKSVLYIRKENLEIAIEILEEIKQENPELIDKFGSPIATALNYSYYALCSRGSSTVRRSLGVVIPHFTFNDAANQIFKISYFKVLATRIKKLGLDKTLSPQNKKILENLLDCEYDYSREEFESTVLKNSSSRHEFLVDIMQSKPELFKDLLSSIDVLEEFKNNIKIFSSLLNFYDTKHTELPMSLLDEFYTDFNVQSSIKEVASEEISTKIRVSKEKYLSLLKAGRVKLAMELANMGLQSEVQGKSKEELREMLFARIELDDESIIDILSGEKEQLYQIVDLLGKDDEYEHRRDYEERFIKLMGIDRVIDAVYTVRDKDAELGRNRKWKFRDALRTVRLERGQAIFESEEFQKLKTREQRNEFIKNFSEHAKYDVEEYYDLYGKSAGYKK